jgi:hypothetical protein
MFAPRTLYRDGYTELAKKRETIPEQCARCSRRARCIAMVIRSSQRESIPARTSGPAKGVH